MKLFAGKPAVFHARAAATGNARSPRLDRSTLLLKAVQNSPLSYSKQQLLQHKGNEKKVIAATETVG